VATRKTIVEPESKMYRSISEVSDMLGVKPHVLRYWETQFSMLRPKKNRAGNRMYRPDEVRMLLRIKELLYDRRYTIEGARRTLLDERREESPQRELGFEVADRNMALYEVKEGLREIVAKLREAVPARPVAARGPAR
jgi:DNA-binding transcriptional MerR regulator